MPSRVDAMNNKSVYLLNKNQLFHYYISRGDRVSQFLGLFINYGFEAIKTHAAARASPIKVYIKLETNK